MIVGAGLVSGLAGGELVDASCDWDWVSESGVAALGVWDSEPVDSAPGASMLGVWDSEPVWALAGKASIAPRIATISKQCLRKADTRTSAPVAHNNVQ